MKVAIHQPQYWPWAPYIHKVMSADVFVYLDNVQFNKNGLQNRNQIKTVSGAMWLTLPTSQHLGQSIMEARVADPKSLRKHFKTLEANYARTEGFLRWREEIRELMTHETTSLCDISIATTEWMLDKLGVKTRRVRASQTAGTDGHATALVASLCRVLDASAYLTGRGALEYMEPEPFRHIQCQVWAQHWKGMAYEQTHTEIGFVPDLSALDLLLNCPDNAADLIRSAGEWSLLWDAA